MRFNYQLLYTLLIVLFCWHCSKKTSQITEQTGPDTTSHLFEWQIDTIVEPEALQISLRGIWGSDENDVWAIGHSDETKYQAWHWDGEKWENHYIHFSGHPHSLRAIQGFASDDIWVVGTDFQNFPNTTYEDFIVHYDGNNWQLTNINAPFCLSVWGTSSENLFVGADSGLILHYDGNNWERQETNTLAQILKIWGFPNGNIYATGAQSDNVQPDDSTTYFFFKYINSEWTILDSVIDYPFAPQRPFGLRLWGNEKGQLYSAGLEGLYTYQNESWSNLEAFDGLKYITGTGENNIFTAGFNNQIFHYNGSNWHLYDQFVDPAEFIWAIWAHNQHVFLTGTVGNYAVIYRGIQK